MTAPEKPSLDGLEDKWAARWEADGTYPFDRSKTRERGLLDRHAAADGERLAAHGSRVLGYTHTDAIARYQRMRGREVFYPMGWDDNGLADRAPGAELLRRALRPVAAVRPRLRRRRRSRAKQAIPISRPNFVELCDRLVGRGRAGVRGAVAHARPVGRLVDDLHDDRRAARQRASQRAFLRNLARGEAYQAEAPTLWDVDFRTAVAQAELEDRELPGAYHALRVPRADGDGDVVIETTRPELIPACVALVAHPDDERYQPLFGTEVTTPLFGVRVPVLAHRLADPEKGSGIAMICTFGDTTDVMWWRELQLPTRAIVGRDGRLRAEPPDWDVADAERRRRYARARGQDGEAGAGARSSSCCARRASSSASRKPITHPVKFYERGDRPLEIVTTRQWYIRNGGRDAELRDALLERGRELHWHPPYMRSRYETLGRGPQRRLARSAASASSACRSRSGTRSTPTASSTTTHPIVPDEDALPGRPVSDVPAGLHRGPARQARRLRRRPRRDGHVGDVVAHAADRVPAGRTTPTCSRARSRWTCARRRPRSSAPGCSPRSCARTSSTARCRGRDAAISGWVLDPDRKKMSKSKGNVVTPMALARAVRLRRGALLGGERPARRRHRVRRGPDEGRPPARDQDPQRVEVRARRRRRRRRHRRLDAVTEPLDRSMLAALADARRRRDRRRSTGYDYARALERTERFFWASATTTSSW